MAQPGAAVAGDSSNVDSRSPTAATAPGAISSATPPASASPTVSQTLSNNDLVDMGKNGRKSATATTAKGETGQGSSSVNQAKHGEKKYAAEDQSARGKQRRGGNKRSKVPKASNPQAFAAGAAAAAAAKRAFMMPAWSQKRLLRKASQNRPQNPRHLALRQGRSASREEEVRSTKSALMRPHPRVNRRERAMGRIRSGAAKSGVRLNIMFKLK